MAETISEHGLRKRESVDEGMIEISEADLTRALDAAFSDSSDRKQSRIQQAISETSERRKRVERAHESLAGLLTDETPDASRVTHVSVRLDVLINLRKQASAAEGEARRIRQALSLLIADAASAGSPNTEAQPEPGSYVVMSDEELRDYMSRSALRPHVHEEPE